MNSNKIFIIGMAGSGKTTIAKELAKIIEYKFIDMNDEIEKEALMFIDEMVEIYGYETVSKTETRLLENLKEDRVVVALNESVILDRNNKKLLDGIVIYIDVDDKILEKRVEAVYPKPIYRDISVADLAKERFLKYRSFANHIISNNGDDPLIAVYDIINVL